MAAVSRGEVWWVELSARQPRPAVVLSREVVLPRLARPLVAWVTTVVRDIPTEVALDEDDGMPRPCVVSLDNVENVSTAVMTERITTLGPERMAAVCRALALAVDCAV